MKYLRRLVWYLATRLLVLCCVLGLMTMAFYFAMNATNIYIILKEGMAKRAQVVMMAEDESTVQNYFTATCIASDRVLSIARNGESPYILYDVTGFDHRLSLEWVWCWPWEDTARATIVESIPSIDGKVIASYKEQLSEAEWRVPEWQSARYSVVLSRENGQWRIKNLTFVARVTP